MLTVEAGQSDYNNSNRLFYLFIQVNDQEIIVARTPPGVTFSRKYPLTEEQHTGLSQQDCAQTHSTLTRPPARADKQTPADFTQTQRNSNLTRQNKRYVLMCGRVIIEVYFQNSPLLFHLPVYQEPHLLLFFLNLPRFQVHCESEGMPSDKDAVLPASGWSCG